MLVLSGLLFLQQLLLSQPSASNRDVLHTEHRHRFMEAHPCSVQALREPFGRLKAHKQSDYLIESSQDTEGR